MLAFGGVGRGLVSLCVVFCVFMMSLAVSVCLSRRFWWGLVSVRLGLCYNHGWED